MKLFEDGDPCFAPMLNALFAAFRGTAVIEWVRGIGDGNESHGVDYSRHGADQWGGHRGGAGSVTLDAGSTFDRYDLVSVNASGSKIVTKGATKRKWPNAARDIPACSRFVFVPAGGDGDRDRERLRCPVVGVAGRRGGAHGAAEPSQRTLLARHRSKRPPIHLPQALPPRVAIRTIRLYQQLKPHHPYLPGALDQYMWDNNILGSPGAPATVWLTLNEVEVPGSRHTSEQRDVWSDCNCCAGGHDRAPIKRVGGKYPLQLPFRDPGIYVPSILSTT